MPTFIKAADWIRSDDAPIPRCYKELCSGVKCKDCWNLIISSTYKSIQQNGSSEDVMKYAVCKHFEVRCFKLLKKKIHKKPSENA